MASTPYRITANIFGPTPERIGTVADGGINACAISLFIFDRKHKSGLEQLLREFTTPGPPGWPAVLGDAFEFLGATCESFLRAGYLLRVDLPRDQKAVEAPDAPIQQIEDLRDLLSKLNAARCDGRLYPVQIWGLERTNVKLAMKAIDSFRLIRFDTNLANSLMDLGCFKLDLSPEWMDLWFPCAKTSEMHTLLNAEAVRLRVKVDWTDHRKE